MHHSGTQTTETKDRLRSFLSDSFLSGEQAAALSDEDDLLAVLDSLQVLRTVMHCESEFGIKVDNSELVPENLGSIDRLAAFIDGKQR
ncbi:MAG: acyl carrier protein [Planctomycetaceae bacterium]